MIHRHSTARLEGSAYWAGLRRALKPRGHSLGTIDGQRPFFIVGAGRSGTTLLRRILCAENGVHIPPETGLLPVIRLYLRYRTASWGELVRAILAYFEYRRDFAYSLRPLAETLRAAPKSDRNLATILHQLYLFDSSERGPGCPRWGDKTPRNYECMDQLLQMFPDAKFVHPLRDGCDVAASLVRYGIQPTLVHGAHAWVDSVETFRSFASDHPDRVYEYRYEELVANPQSIVEPLCRFLELEYNEDMVTNSHSDTSRLAPELAMDHHQNLRDPISAAHIGKGRDELTEKALSEMAPILDATLGRLGYPLCASRT